MFKKKQKVTKKKKRPWDGEGKMQSSWINSFFISILVIYYIILLIFYVFDH